MLSRMHKISNKLRNDKGMSLVEVILMIVILGIAVVPLSRLSISNLTSGGRYSKLTKASYYAEEIMEQIIADYAAIDAGLGYNWVIGNWPGSVSNSPEGFSGNVSISAEDTLNSVVYVEVLLTVSGSDIPDVSLTTWLVK